MHPLGTPLGLPSSSGPSYLASGPGDLDSCFTERNEVTTKPRIHVLSVGRVEPRTLVRNALVNSPHLFVSFIPDYRELWTSSKQQVVHAAVLHNSLCSFELAEAARLVRYRWPSARILIIRSGQVSLDRHLYDQRLHSHVRQGTLVEQILKLTHALQEGDNSRGND